MNEPDIGRIAMPRKPSNARRNQRRQAPLVSENLEERRLLNGSFSHKDRQFSYATPSGGHALVQIIGRGSLAGTTVTGGELNLVYGRTNAFSKIVSQVHGGNGRAPLAGIHNSQLAAAGAQNSTSGVGGNVLQAVLLGQFDLVDGGSINLTSGVNTVILDSVGSNTEIHLRALPPAPTPASSNFTSTSPVSIITTSGTTGAVISGVTSTPASSTGTLEAGQSTTVTLNGVSAQYISNKINTQTLASISGNFEAGTNLVEPLATGQPPSIPPAPPGIIFKANSIAGSLTGSAPIDLLTDPKIFGYDPATGQLIRFSLNLANNTGAVDSSFPAISVPGDPAVAGVNLASNGGQLDVLVSSGTTVYAYNATTGALVGSFTTSVPIGSIAAVDNVTVLGSYTPNQLEMINLATSLQTGVAQVVGQPFTPKAGFTLLGGLSGLPGSTNLYADVAATFNSFQPTVTQLGIQSISTAEVLTVKGHGTVLSNQLTGGTSTALTQKGNFITATPGAVQPGPAVGSIDQSLALVASASGGTNTINLYSTGSSSSSGTITLSYADQLGALSSTFRPDLTGSALIDIQGNVQSIRGGSATGMVLNDSGNLNLVKIDSVTDSTIIGQPVGHLQISQRSNVTVLTPSRTVGKRNDVTVNPDLNPIGPLSQTGDQP
jgi:hypothetical protein